MRQILLFTIALFISFSALSQNSSIRLSSGNDSFLENKKDSPELKIYPNPCKTNKITIDFNSLLIAEIQITSITGKQVLKKKFDFTENKKQLQLNEIQNGIYLVKVKSDNNKTVVKKLIVSKQ